MTIYAVDYYLHYITIIYQFTICQHEHTQTVFLSCWISLHGYLHGSTGWTSSQSSL